MASTTKNSGTGSMATEKTKTKVIILYPAEGLENPPKDAETVLADFQSQVAKYKSWCLENSVDFVAAIGLILHYQYHGMPGVPANYPRSNAFNVNPVLEMIAKDPMIKGVVLTRVWNDSDPRDFGRFEDRDKKSKLLIATELKQALPDIRIASLEFAYSNDEKIRDYAELFFAPNTGSFSPIAFADFMTATT